METRPLLELRIHLVNGNTHRFIQNDPGLVQDIISQIHGRLFSQPTLAVSGENQVRVYQVSTISGISLIMDPLPVELLMLDRTSPSTIWEVTETEYLAKQRFTLPEGPDQPVQVLSEVEMTSGHRFWIESEIPRSEVGLDERKILGHTFKLPNLVCRRRGGGGISIWNRSHMVSVTYSSKPDAALIAWPAEATEDLVYPSRRLDLNRLRAMNTLRRTEVGDSQGVTTRLEVERPAVEAAAGSLASEGAHSRLAVPLVYSEGRA